MLFIPYNLVRMSDAKGLIKLNSDTNRFVEIKIGRFLKSLFKQIKPVSNLEIKNNR
jgi:hypothetical protein